MDKIRHIRLIKVIYSSAKKRYENRTIFAEVISSKCSVYVRVCVYVYVYTVKIIVNISVYD